MAPSFDNSLIFDCLCFVVWLFPLLAISSCRHKFAWNVTTISHKLLPSCEGKQITGVVTLMSLRLLIHQSRRNRFRCRNVAGRTAICPSENDGEQCRASDRHVDCSASFACNPHSQHSLQAKYLNAIELTVCGTKLPYVAIFLRADFATQRPERLYAAILSTIVLCANSPVVRFSKAKWGLCRL